MPSHVLHFCKLIINVTSLKKLLIQRLHIFSTHCYSRSGNPWGLFKIVPCKQMWVFLRITLVKINQSTHPSFSSIFLCNGCSFFQDATRCTGNHFYMTRDFFSSTWFDNLWAKVATSCKQHLTPPYNLLIYFVWHLICLEVNGLTFYFWTSIIFIFSLYHLFSFLYTRFELKRIRKLLARECRRPCACFIWTCNSGLKMLKFQGQSRSQMAVLNSNYCSPYSRPWYKRRHWNQMNLLQRPFE